MYCIVLYNCGFVLYRFRDKARCRPKIAIFHTPLHCRTVWYRNPAVAYFFCDRMYIVVADDADDWGDSGSTRLYLTFDGENWVMYDLSLLPDTYHRVNRREKVEITFRTNGPDGLIWYSGNERDNVALYLRVC